MNTLQKNQGTGRREPGRRGRGRRAAGAAGVLSGITAGIVTGAVAGLFVLLPGVWPGADALPRAEAGIIAYRTYLDLHLPRPGEPGFREPSAANDTTDNTANGTTSGAGSKDKANGKKQAPRPGKLTLDQREKLADERNRILHQWDTMSDEELRQAMTTFQEHVRAERMKNMTPEEQKAYRKRVEAREKEREQVSRMTEEQRHAYFQKKRAALVKQKLKTMSKEERKVYLEREKRREARMDAFREQWKNMTPEEQKAWRRDHPMPGGI